MINFSQPIPMRDLDDVVHLEFLHFMTNYCLRGDPMHRDALISVVLKLIQISRNLGLKQSERDDAATLASNLANAGLKAYGSESDFAFTLKSSIQTIASDNH